MKNTALGIPIVKQINKPKYHLVGYPGHSHYPHKMVAFIVPQSKLCMYIYICGICRSMKKMPKRSCSFSENNHISILLYYNIYYIYIYLYI